MTQPALSAASATDQPTGPFPEPPDTSAWPALHISRHPAVLHKLAAEADIFITNMPPQVREKLGITWEHLAPTNERLIYASFTGYGEKGEEANKPGFDSNAYWARSGLMDLVRADTDTTPARSV